MNTGNIGYNLDTEQRQTNQKIQHRKQKTRAAQNLQKTER